MNAEKAAIQDIIDAARRTSDPFPAEWQAVVPLLQSAPDMAKALQGCLSAMATMQTQLDYLKQMHPDEDGSVQDASDAHEEARNDAVFVLGKAGIEPPAAPRQPATRLLKDCLGAISSLQHQVGQMSGMFDDDDGTIQEACSDADETTERVRSYLSGQFVTAVDASAGANRYRVGWVIDIHADTPEQAAEKAAMLGRRVFTVTEGRNTSTVDLGPP